MYRYIKNNNNITKCFCISCIFIYFLDSFTNFFFSATCLINFNLVITQHQFYRLFTAPLIHANIIPLSSNLLLLFFFTFKLKSLFPTPLLLSTLYPFSFIRLSSLCRFYSTYQRWCFRYCLWAVLRFSPYFTYYIPFLQLPQY